MRLLSSVYLFGLILGLATATQALAEGETIALIQYDGDRHYGDYDSNMANLTHLALEAVDDGAQVIVMPEGSAYGYASSDRLWCRPELSSYNGRDCDDVSQVAETVPGGRTSDYWSLFARQQNVTVLFSIMEKFGNKFFNTTVAVDASGYLGRYRKRYLYWVDEAYASPGSDLFVLERFGRKLGVMICMDTNYSSLFQSYGAAGVDGIIAPMDWDQSPHSNRAGRIFFRQQASRYLLDLFVSDQSAWDSTGYYPASGAERTRFPLADVAVGTDGYVIAPLARLPN